jgi:sugar phosphate isomerase/epimerase
MESVSINQATTLRWNFFEDVVRYAGMGIESIGVLRTKLEDEDPQDAIDLLFEMKMSVSSLSWIGGFTGSDGISHQQALDDAHDAIRQAAQLHAGCLIVYPGAQNGHTDNHARRLFRTALDELIPVAQDHGVRLAIEPMSLMDGYDRSFFDGTSELLAWADDYAPSALGLVLDLFHVGHNLKLLQKLPQFASRVALVQIADRRDGCIFRCQRRHWGEGDLPLHSWLAALQRDGYQGPYELELCGREFTPNTYRQTIRRATNDVVQSLQRVRSDLTVQRD